MGTPQEVRGYLENLPADERKSALRRLETADLVVYSLADGEPAFWEFVQLGRADLPPDVWRPGGGERLAYIFGAFTRGPYRGHGLFTGGLHWLIDWLAEHGYTHLYSQPAVDDVVSLLAHLTAGFEALGEGRHVHWGGRRIARRTRLLARPVAADCAQPPDLRAVSAVARRSLCRALLCPR
jgi:GNAT superfamily N-acetyltransferase